MTREIESRMVECMRPLFGEFATSALEQQKAKLGLRDRLGAAEYARLVEEIREMCTEVAGAAIADRVYTNLIQIVKEVS